MASSRKMVTLMSSDGQKLDVEEAVAMQSQTTKELIEKGNHAVEPIPLQTITSATLGNVIEYCDKHVDNSFAKEELDAWDADFVNDDSVPLINLANASCDLRIESLKDLIAKTIAGMLSGKTPEQMRRILNIPDSETFTTEEEEEIRRENQWAFG